MSRATIRPVAGTHEPVVRSGDKIQVHCPECQQLGTHLGTCSWSQMRSGRVWTFYAEAICFVTSAAEGSS